MLSNNMFPQTISILTLQLITRFRVTGIIVIYYHTLSSFNHHFVPLKSILQITDLNRYINLWQFREFNFSQQTITISQLRSIMIDFHPVAEQ